MAPLPESNTARLLVHYNGPRGPHTLQFRQGADSNLSDLIESVGDVMQAMMDLCWATTTTTGADYIAVGSNISNPVAFPTIVSTNTGNPQADIDGFGFFAQFGARSTDGRRAFWYVYNAALRPTSNMVIAANANPEVEAVCNALTLASGDVATISGLGYIVKSYANVNYNDHLVKNARKGA